MTIKEMLERHARIEELKIDVQHKNRHIEGVYNVCYEILKNTPKKMSNVSLIKKRIKCYFDLIAMHEKKLESFESELKKLRSECSHELVIGLGKKMPHDEENNYAKCLCCGKELDLNFVDKDNLLDVRGLVSDANIYTNFEGENVLVREAQEMFDRMYVNNPDLSKEKVKMYLMQRFINLEPFTESIQYLKVYNPELAQAKIDEIMTFVSASRSGAKR